MEPVRPDPPEDDDSALRWEGDEELGRMTSLDEASVEGADRDSREPSVEDLEQNVVADGLPARPRDRLLTLVSAGFAVLFLAETVGWIFVLQGAQSAGDVFATGSGVLDFVGGITRFLALVAAPLWYVATVQLTRELRTRRRLSRFGWLALGSGVLVPWPLLLGFLR